MTALHVLALVGALLCSAWLGWVIVLLSGELFSHRSERAP